MKNSIMQKSINTLWSLEEEYLKNNLYMYCMKCKKLIKIKNITNIVFPNDNESNIEENNLSKNIVLTKKIRLWCKNCAKVKLK